MCSIVTVTRLVFLVLLYRERKEAGVGDVTWGCRTDGSWGQVRPGCFFPGLAQKPFGVLGG